jgi:hypothetical protein
MGNSNIMSAAMNMEFLFQRNQTPLQHMQRPGGIGKDSICGFQVRSHMKHILGGVVQARAQENKSCKGND